MPATDRLAITSGMRQGELLGLRWADVDLERGTLTVPHTLRVRAYSLDAPKTERSRRTLRLGAESLGALPDQRRWQAADRIAAGRKWHDLDFVFATTTGVPLASRVVTRSLQSALARGGFRRQRFHDLRHAFATLMIEAGEDLAVVSKSLGHSNLSTTADVYAHLTDAMGDRAAAQMDSILRAV